MKSYISTNLKAYRKSNRYSQETVARMAGIDVNTYRHIEHGKTNPFFLTMYRICNSLEISLDDVIKKDKHNENQINFLKIKYRRNPQYHIYKIDNNLRKVRKNMRLTQRTLAEMSEMSIHCLRCVDRNYNLPSLPNALKIAKALKTSVDRLFIIKEIPKEID